MIADCPHCAAPLTVSPAHAPGTLARCGDCRGPVRIGEHALTSASGLDAACSQDPLLWPAARQRSDLF